MNFPPNPKNDASYDALYASIVCDKRTALFIVVMSRFFTTKFPICPDENAGRVKTKKTSNFIAMYDVFSGQNHKINGNDQRRFAHSVNRCTII